MYQCSAYKRMNAHQRENLQRNRLCSIARECPEQHLHIDDDWVIVEPVDSDYRPVVDGQPADRLLSTNLVDFTQPFIRYEITDRVVLHREPCACGNPSP